MPDKSLEEVFVDELGELYDAEQRLIQAMPKLAGHATAENLTNVLEKHSEQSREHSKRLEQVFELLGETPRRNDCNAMGALLTECDCLTRESSQEAVRDTAILAAAQKLMHYEIASYVTLREWAQQLGKLEVSALLQKSLDEENTADATLSQMALTLNNAAAHAG